MDFFEKTGQMAIGSRLRMLTDRITADAGRIYELYGVALKPKWFPVFFLLSDGNFRTITGIAREIGHTHPSVSNLVKEMSARGLLCEQADPNDRRKTRIGLSEKGQAMSADLAEQCRDVSAAIDALARESRHDLWRAIEEWEAMLSEKSLYERVKAVKREREGREIRILPYEAAYDGVFRSLNEQWITSHWELEAHDREVLDHPQERIIDAGGYIWVATFRERPVGVCALCRMDDPHYDYELAKLAVDPSVRGKGIGLRLCETAVAKARETGARRLFLESNTLLEPAIHLYRKIGFRELASFHPAYARGDIQMELEL